MPERPCEHCGQSFTYKASREGRARFCSQRCLGYANKERLERQRAEVFAATGSRTFGVEPWSKTHAKGLHLSPRSEFAAGHTPRNKLPVGTVTVRNDKNGRPRAWVKVAEPNRWKLRAVVTWEATHGQLPKGQLVHHCDRDSLNDRLENLQALTSSQHAKEHEQDLIRSRQDRRGLASLVVALQPGDT